jgi:hypothetical protein
MCVVFLSGCKPVDILVVFYIGIFAWDPIIRAGLAIPFEIMDCTTTPCPGINFRHKHSIMSYNFVFLYVSICISVNNDNHTARVICES